MTLLFKRALILIIDQLTRTFTDIYNTRSVTSTSLAQPSSLETKHPNTFVAANRDHRLPLTRALSDSV
jgi:hypothetical protein